MAKTWNEVAFCATDLVNQQTHFSDSGWHNGVRLWVDALV